MEFLDNFSTCTAYLLVNYLQPHILFSEKNFTIFTCLTFYSLWLHPTGYAILNQSTFIQCYREQSNHDSMQPRKSLQSMSVDSSRYIHGVSKQNCSDLTARTRKGHFHVTAYFHPSASGRERHTFPHPPPPPAHTQKSNCSGRKIKTI